MQHKLVIFLPFLDNLIFNESYFLSFHQVKEGQELKKIEKKEFFY